LLQRTRYRAIAKRVMRILSGGALGSTEAPSNLHNARLRFLGLTRLMQIKDRIINALQRDGGVC
jgi:hypothetical protein